MFAIVIYLSYKQFRNNFCFWNRDYVTSAIWTNGALLPRSWFRYAHRTTKNEHNKTLYCVICSPNVLLYTFSTRVTINNREKCNAPTFKTNNRKLPVQSGVSAMLRMRVRRHLVHSHCRHRLAQSSSVSLERLSVVNLLLITAN